MLNITSTKSTDYLDWNSFVLELYFKALSELLELPRLHCETVGLCRDAQGELACDPQLEPQAFLTLRRRAAI
jgi:hypothetical protein